MQLSKIKLAGFKSFVDTTTIAFPSHLVAIVGPNGCGKSNIIDAVTWVMGESSPKYLRGEALTDVIFNGSSSRKPVGQASVELVFDNADGSLGGEHAKFAEISIKRVINRESDSVYYLNGVRCRKRDVVDIFRGTGLGPRSYSIVGQNMISRVIEAKPDELRTYLEEAAGISKYKERRHETELRIGHTKENLARVSDLAGELEKQLSHLKHQASVAEKFKSLKQQERLLRAEWYGIQWRQLDCALIDSTLQIKREETTLEGRHSELSSADREIEQLRHEQRVARDAFQEVQRRYYAVGNEITRIEQDVLHHQEREQQWVNDLKHTEGEWQAIKNQIAECDEDFRELEHDIQQVEPQLSTASHDADSLQDELSAAEEAMQNWQTQWDTFNQTAAKTTQTAQVEQTHIQHREQHILSLQKRKEQLQQDQSRCNFAELNDEMIVLTKQADEVAQQLALQNEQLDDCRQELLTQKKAEQEAHAGLDKLRSELQRLQGQQAALRALQQTALGQRDNPTTPWLNQHQLADKPRLAQHLEVAPGYELAVEKVLGYCLQAICVDNLSDVLLHLKDFNSGNLCVVAATPALSSNNQRKNATLLLEKITTPWPLDALLSGIYVEDSLDAASQLCESLDANESVITRDGIWLNRSWLKILHEEDAAQGVFQREQELKQLAINMEASQQAQTKLEKNIVEYREKIQTLEQKRDQLQQTCSQHQAQSAQFQAQQKMKQERVNELKMQSARLLQEQQECIAALQKTEGELMQARTLWQAAMHELQQQDASRDALVSERDNARLQLQSLRQTTHNQQERMHELAIRLETAKSQKSSLQQAMAHLQAQLANLTERKITLQGEISSMPPLDTLKKSLSRALDKHVSIEVELNTARVLMESLDQEFRALEIKRQTIEHEINKIRNTLEALRVEWQGWKVKSDTINEQMKETEFALEDILKNLPQDGTAEVWEGKLEQVVQRINRLGPINLVAIDEYATCLERKQYLDKQLEDLHSGLATLEEAIAKIDKETRARFKDTFDQVNARFQELFPTIFGGGKAYLELTSDDLL